MAALYALNRPFGRFPHEYIIAGTMACHEFQEDRVSAVSRRDQGVAEECPGRDPVPGQSGSVDKVLDCGHREGEQTFQRNAGTQYTKTGLSFQTQGSVVRTDLLTALTAVETVAPGTSVRLGERYGLRTQRLKAALLIQSARFGKGADRTGILAGTAGAAQVKTHLRPGWGRTSRSSARIADPSHRQGEKEPGDDKQGSDSGNENQTVLTERTQPAQQGQRFFGKTGVAENPEVLLAQVVIPAEGADYGLQAGNRLAIIVPPGEGRDQGVGIPGSGCVVLLLTVAGQGGKQEGPLSQGCDLRMLGQRPGKPIGGQPSDLVKAVIAE
jgi:hypothetical protein